MSVACSVIYFTVNEYFNPALSCIPSSIFTPLKEFSDTTNTKYNIPASTAVEIMNLNKNPIDRLLYENNDIIKIPIKNPVLLPVNNIDKKHIIRNGNPFIKGVLIFFAE